MRPSLWDPNWSYKQQEKTTGYIQGNLHQIVGGFFSRKFAAEGNDTIDSQYERKKNQSEVLYHSQLRKRKEFFRQANVKGVLHY